MDPTPIATVMPILLPALVQIGTHLAQIPVKALLKPAQDLADDAVLQRFRAIKENELIIAAIQDAARDIGIGPEDSVWLKIAIDTLAAPQNESLRKETVEAVFSMVDQQAMPSDLPDKLHVPQSSRERFGSFLYHFRRHIVAIEEFERRIAYEDRTALLQQQARMDEKLEILLARVEPRPTVEVPLPSSTEPRSLLERTLLSQIQQARDLRLGGKPLAAKQILESVSRAAQEAEVSNDVRFQLETNLGACELELGNAQEAAGLFDHAMGYFPNSPKALANAALGKVLRREYQLAAELAEQSLAYDAGNLHSSAAAIRVDALAHLRNFANVEELYDEKYRDNPDYLRAIGAAFLKAGNLTKAEEMLRLANLAEPAHDKNLILLAQVIFRRKIEPYRDQVFVPLLGQGAFADDLSEAELLMDEAVVSLEKGDNQLALLDALAARAGLRGALDKVSDAIQDCDRVLAHYPKHPIALYNRGLIARRQGDFRAAIQFLGAVPEKELRDLNGFLPLADAYVHLNMPEQALEVLARMPKQFTERHFIDTFLIESQALIRNGDLAEAEGRKRQILATHPNHPIVLEVCAFLEFEQGHIDAALAHLIDAHKHAQDPEKQHIALRLASHYSKQRQFEQAIQYFSEVTALTASDNVHGRQYLVDLYNARQYSQAEEVARQLRAVGSNHPIVIEILARIDEQTGDLKAATDLYSELIKLEPDKPEHTVAKARVLFRRGDTESARLLLLTLKQIKMENALDLIQVAQMLLFLGERSDVARLAYRARQLGFDLPHIHLAYFQIFTNLGRVAPSDYEVDRVIEDSAVLVDDLHGERRWLKILASFPADRSKNEFSKDDPVARILMGKRKGDIVQIKTGPVEELSYRIEDVQSIYVRAYQETGDNFGTWFPEHDGISKAHVPLGDPTKLLTIVAGQSVVLEEVYRIYDSGQLTFSQFASLVGRDEIDLWDGLAGSANRRLLASSGTRAQQVSDLAIAKDAQSVTVDLTALLTSHFLGLFGALSQRFSHLYTPQATIDAISHSIQMLSMTGKPGFATISFEGGKFTIREIPEEAVEETLRRRRELLEQSLAICQVIPITAESITLFHHETPEGSWHLSSAATLLVARQTASSLYADDLRLRSIAEGQLRIPGFWTQTLLQNLRDQGTITDKDYFDKCIKLIQAHYFFTAIQPTLLVYVLEKNSMRIAPEVSAVFRTLEGPHSDEDDAVRIIAETLAEVWLSRWLEEQKIFVLDQSLRTLTAGRPDLLVLQKLLVRLDRNLKLQLAVGVLSRIRAEIKNWYETRRLTR